jgi:hypothetical protein
MLHIEIFSYCLSVRTEDMPHALPRRKIGGPGWGRFTGDRREFPPSGGGGGREGREDHEHPVVEPQVMHLRHVPLRTRVKLPQSPQESPS